MLKTICMLSLTILLPIIGACEEWDGSAPWTRPWVLSENTKPVYSKPGNQNYFPESSGRTIGECNTSCGGIAPVEIDMANQCMCVQGLNNTNSCFFVGIGSEGPSMTTSGSGFLGEADGEKYQTTRYTSTDYDKDAIAMGIPGNDNVGKWIHKPANCVNAKTYHTRGCIAVPCEQWPKVKGAMLGKKQLTVCHGLTPGGARGHRRRPASRTDQ